MSRRHFNEAELRAMLACVEFLRPAAQPGRWSATTRHMGAPWEVILEPEPWRRELIVVTAYRLRS
jgi:hypothetical protein